MPVQVLDGTLHESIALIANGRRPLVRQTAGQPQLVLNIRYLWAGQPLTAR